MYCENCGNKIIDGHGYCANCGKLADINKTAPVSNEIDKKSLSYLKTKWWYRLIKVIYFVCLIISIVFVAMVSYSINFIDNGSAFCYSLLFVVIVWVIYIAIRMGFYYVVLGKFRPQK